MNERAKRIVRQEGMDSSRLAMRIIYIPHTGMPDTLVRVSGRRVVELVGWEACRGLACRRCSGIGDRHSCGRRIGVGLARILNDNRAAAAGVDDRSGYAGSAIDSGNNGERSIAIAVAVATRLGDRRRGGELERTGVCSACVSDRNRTGLSGGGGRSGRQGRAWSRERHGCSNHSE